MTDPELNILISADYEPFLGRNFADYEEVLFTPTERLMQICESLSVPITFFADVCSVWAHRDLGLHDYADRFEAQMQLAAQRGHDVQLHLHPHWLQSTYQDGRWEVATDRMYLSELGFSDHRESAPAVIMRGVQYLNDLLQPIRSGYRCEAFRAAGLALQPEERRLIASLLQAGISIDSSIAKGVVLDLDTVRLDYRDVPHVANWYLTPESGIGTAAEAGLLEVPVATFRSTLRERLGFLWRRLRSVGMRRGAGIARSARQTKWAGLKTMLAYNLRYVGTDPWFLLSCDTKGMSRSMLCRGFERFVQEHHADRMIIASMINHPKLMFEPQFTLLSDFVKWVRARYHGSIRFITTRDVHRLIDRSSLDSG